MTQKHSKKVRLLTIALSAALLLSGCNTNEANTATTSAAAESTVADSPESTASAAATSAEDLDVTFTANDLDVGYDETTSTAINLSDDGITVDGSGAAADGSIVTITAEGTYILTGTLSDGQVIIKAPETAKIQLVLNGVTLHCETYSALLIEQADKVFITLAEGSENTLSDGSTYSLVSEDDNVDGVIFSRADLTINGSGTLTVNASYKHAIVSKDDLVITGGTYHITAASGGLYGKDCVKIADGTFNLQTVSNAIKSSNAEDAGRGFVYISGGTFEISTEGDAIQAETVLWIDNGDITIKAGGGASVMPSDEISTKGLKAGNEIIINDGTFNLDTSDDSVHSNGDLTITGGDFTIASGDDGMHADSDLLIQEGNILITGSYEGIEGNAVIISGGTIDITASDDGINAAGGSDTTDTTGRPGQDMFAADESCYIEISGGVITINSSADGIDSNGSLTVSGGEVYISGPESGADGALDYDGSAVITGGIIVAAGSSGMAQGFGTDSTQCSIFYNLDTSYTGGTAITLSDADGKELVSYTPVTSYQSVVISAPELIDGETYTLTCGEDSFEVTLSGTVTTVGNAGFGGGGGGGFGGGGGGMNRSNQDDESGTMPDMGNGAGAMPDMGDSSGTMPDMGNGSGTMPDMGDGSGTMPDMGDGQVEAPDLETGAEVQ